MEFAVSCLLQNSHLFTLSLWLSIFMAACSATNVLSMNQNSESSPTFPSNFLFGTASSSYQVEGAFLSDGKGLSNWDVFTHKPGNIMDGTNGDIAVDKHHRYEEDVDLMKDIGVNSYRFSISWARILPKGRFGKVNKQGLEYYDLLINAILRKGIKPFVTLAHFDIPQELEDRYNAWLSPKIQQDFKYYAEICFKKFGDRVKNWVTLNEPNVAVINGYRRGIWPPSSCSASLGNCSHGNSEKDPFVAAHNLILSHVSAVHLYRTKYQGLSPLANSSEDKLAAERAQSFYFNWFLDPIIWGKYPSEMKEILGHDLPEFSKYELEKLKNNGIDFIGVNHYTSYYAKDCIFSECEPGLGASKTEGFALYAHQRNGIFLGDQTAVDRLYVHPKGMEKMIIYIKERYNNLPMFITENGYGEIEDPNPTTRDIIHVDVQRVNYLSSYLNSLATAIRKGADVRGYFVWSLLDNFEWKYGCSVRFGLYHVHYIWHSQ